MTENGTEAKNIENVVLRKEKRGTKPYEGKLHKAWEIQQVV